MSNLINTNYEIRETEPQTDTTKLAHLPYNGLRPQFKGAQANDTFESSEKKNNGKAIWITLFSLTGLTALALGLLARKGGKTLGKDAKLGEKIEQGWRELWGKGKKAAEESINNHGSEPHNPDINGNESVKQINKGRAILNNGTNYTGTIKNSLKDGSEVLSEYENGFIKKATKIHNGETLYTKNYTFDEKGFLSKVNVKRGDAETEFLYSHYDNGKLRSFSHGKVVNKFIYNDNGSLKYHFLHDGKKSEIYDSLIKYHEGTNIPEYVFDTQTKNLYIHDENGKVLRWVTMDGANQRLYSKNYKEQQIEEHLFGITEPSDKHFSCNRVFKGGSCNLGEFMSYNNLFTYNDGNGVIGNIEKTIWEYSDRIEIGTKLDFDFPTSLGEINVLTNNRDSKNVLKMFGDKYKELGTYNILTSEFIPAENSPLTKEIAENIARKYKNCLSDMKQMYKRDIRANIDIYEDMINTAERGV